MNRRMMQMICSVLVCLWVLPVFAQDNPITTMKIVREALKTGKRAFIRVNMNLSDSESKAFWETYDSYQDALRKINDRRSKLIADYAVEYYKLTDEKGKELLEEALAVEEEMIKFRRSYLSKFNAILPPKKVARYYQLENKIQALIRYDLADRIPLVQ